MSKPVSALLRRASSAQIVEIYSGCIVQPIVPHDEVVYPQRGCVNELPLCRVAAGQKGGPLNCDGFELLPHATLDELERAMKAAGISSIQRFCFVQLSRHDLIRKNH